MHFGVGNWLELVAVLALVLFSAFLSMAETSLTRISRPKAQALVDQRRPRAVRLAQLVSHPSRYLNTVLFLTLVSQLVAATLVGVMADHLLGALGVVVAVVVEILVIFVIGEAIPKNLAVVRPEGSALFVAPVVSVLVRFWPIRMIASAVGRVSLWLTPGGAQLVSSVSEEELLAMADAAEEGDVIETEERALIHSVINFGDTVVREVMVPRPDVVALERTTGVDDAIDLVLQVGKSRLPVYEGDLDNVVGVVLTRDLLAAARIERGSSQVGRLMRTAHFVPETKPVADLLREMKAGKFHIAVVVDEYGSTAGLVTMEDLIEELVGDIEDEYDVDVEPIIPLPDGGLQVRGNYSVDALGEYLEVDLPEGDWDTVAGLVIGILGHLPTVGESLNIGGLRFLVSHTVRHRVDSLVIRPNSSDISDLKDAK